MSGTGSNKLQLSPAVRSNNAQVKIHQHRRRRTMGIVARGTRSPLIHNVLPVLAETAILKDAVLNVVALVAQRIIGKRVSSPGSIAPRYCRRRFQQIVSLQNMRQAGAVRAGGTIAGTAQVPPGIAVMAVSAVNQTAGR